MPITPSLKLPAKTVIARKKMIQSRRAVWCSVSSDYLLPNEVLDTDVLREIEEQEQWEDLERSIPSCSERNRAF